MYYYIKIIVHRVIPGSFSREDNNSEVLNSEGY